VPVFTYLPLLFAAITSAGTAPAAHREATRSSPAACSVIGRADVQEALGGSFAKGKASREGSQSSCDYSGGTGQVTITLERLAGPLDLRAEIASLKESIPEGKLRAAQGISATAFFLDIPGAGTQLYVVRDDADFVMISVLGFGEASRVSPAAEILARKALGRL
jgi:hypothetical protein